jgi:hypothetical protein
VLQPVGSLSSIHEEWVGSTQRERLYAVETRNGRSMGLKREKTSWREGRSYTRGTISRWYYGKSHQAGIDPRLGASLKQLSAATNSPTLQACPDTTHPAVVLAELAERRHSTRSRWMKAKSRGARRALFMIRCPEGETAFRWAGDIGRAPRRALQARTAHGMGGWRMADGLQGGRQAFPEAAVSYRQPTRVALARGFVLIFTRP